MEQGTKILSGKAVFDLMKERIYGRVHRHDRLESVEYADVFNELPFTMLEHLRIGAARAFSANNGGLEFRGAFTGVDAQGDVHDVYFRLADLRDVMSKTVNDVSPKSVETLMADFESAAVAVQRRRSHRNIVNNAVLEVIPGYGCTAEIQTIRVLEADERHRSYKNLAPV